MPLSLARSVALVFVSAILVMGAAGCRSRGDVATVPGSAEAIHANARKALRKRLPTAHELVYDNYNFFVIGYSPTERPSDAIVSMAAGANGVGLCFIHGARLRDPNKILQGSGNQTRFLRLESVEVLARPEVEDLFAGDEFV